MSRVARVRVVALNPSVDVEWRTGPLRSEEKNELLSETRWPGGKGVNVSRWLRWLGIAPRLLLPLGGAVGRELANGLKAEGIRFDVHPLAAGNRVNYLVTPSSGPQFRFNATWPRLRATDCRALRKAADAAAVGFHWTIFSGTLPFGAPRDTYAWLVRQAVRRGQKVVLDCDGEAFALAAAQHPFLVKPNEFELAQWAGTEFRTDAELFQAARRLSETTEGWVLVTRGPKGALLLNSKIQNAWMATPPTVEVRNTVGAGDATVAGAVAGLCGSDDPATWLRLAVGTGTTATQVAPGQLATLRTASQTASGVVIRECPGVFP